MKENKYDNPVFFEKYRQMPRSQHGLLAAGEWNQLRQMLPDFTNKRVLDLGCGYGWHCIYATEHGAQTVCGCDISSKMLEVAKAKTNSHTVRYQHGAMEDLVFEPESFDVVLSSLAFHYIMDFPDMLQKISNWLCPQGELIFSIEHPTFTASGNQDWIYDENGNIRHFALDNYFGEGARNAVFLGEHVIKYHRTLTSIINTLLANNFQITQLVEPQPPIEMMSIPGMADELRRPMMLLIKAQKA